MSNSIVLPAGRYYLGDPCYIFQNGEVWSKLLDHSDMLEKFVYFDGRNGFMGHGHIACSRTMYGDGTYKTSYHDAGLGVDAGMIGVIDERIVLLNASVEDLADIWNPKVGPAPQGYLGIWVEFDKPFTFTKKNAGGTITVGNIEVYTGDEGDDNHYIDEWNDSDDQGE